MIPVDTHSCGWFPNLRDGYIYAVWEGRTHAYSQAINQLSNKIVSELQVSRLKIAFFTIFFLFYVASHSHSSSFRMPAATYRAANCEMHNRVPPGTGCRLFVSSAWFISLVG
jgi:hypothetical protein